MVEIENEFGQEMEIQGFTTNMNLVSINLKFKIACVLTFLNFTAYAQSVYQIRLTDKQDTTSKIQKATLYNQRTHLRSLSDAYGISTISGQDGDIIQISCMGYNSVSLPLSAALKVGKVSLQQATYELSEVTIKPKPNIIELLKLCRQNLELSENGKSFEQKGFLKERIFEANIPVGYLDAFISIYNGGYSKKYDKNTLQFMNSDLLAITDFRRSAYPDYYYSEALMKQYALAPVPNVLTVIYEKKKYLHRKLFTEAFFKYFDFQYLDDIVSDKGNDVLYVIRYKLKKEYLENVVSEVMKNKDSYLFGGTISIKSTSAELAGFTINQTDYQEIIWKSNAYRAAVDLAINYLNIGGDNLLNNMTLTSLYRKDGRLIRIVDEVSIESEIAKELNETEIAAIYGATSMYKDVRIQRRPQKPNIYDPNKWVDYAYLLTPQIVLPIEKKYTQKIDQQFRNQNIIYTNKEKQLFNDQLL